MKKAIKYTDEPIKAKIIKDFLPPPGKLRFRQSALRVTYDTETDRLRLTFRQGAIWASKEVSPGIVVDRNVAGDVLSLELLDASKRGANPKALEFAVS